MEDARTALVTGAAGGLGRAIVNRLAADGMDVLAVDLKAVEDGPGVPFAADLSTRAGNAECVAAALDAFGRLDVVVSGAGMQHVTPTREFPEDQWDRMLAVMLTSPFLLARYAWDALAASGAGRFIALGSAHSHIALPGKAPYVAAKHGVLGLVRVLALEGAEAGIAAVAVCPGYARTPLVLNRLRAEVEATGQSEDDVMREMFLAPHAIQRLVEPDEVAAVVAMLAGPLGETFTGTPVTMDLGVDGALSGVAIAEPVLIVTGPPGAGKTTVAGVVAAGYPRAVHVQSDWFFRFIVAGHIEPWRPESHEQNALVMQIVARAAAAYADAGYFTLIDGIVIPRWFLEPLREHLSAAGHAVAYAVLRPSLDTCLRRTRSREPGQLVDPTVVEQMWREFAQLGPLEAHAVDSGTQTAADTAEVLTERLRRGLLAL